MESNHPYRTANLTPPPRPTWKERNIIFIRLSKLLLSPIFALLWLITMMTFAILLIVSTPVEMAAGYLLYGNRKHFYKKDPSMTNWYDPTILHYFGNVNNLFYGYWKWFEQ